MLNSSLQHELHSLKRYNSKPENKTPLDNTAYKEKITEQSDLPFHKAFTDICLLDNHIYVFKFCNKY